MFSATLVQSSILRKIVDSIKDLVPKVNLEATPLGLSVQAMDSAHVSLVSLMLRESGFESYRCDKNITLGLDLSDFSKILKLSSNDDQVTLKAQEDNSYLTIIYTNNKTAKECEFNLTLMTIESDSLGIPDSEYPTIIKMSSSEFVKLCKDLTPLTESIKIECSGEKEAKISYSGKTGNGSIKLRKHLADKEDDFIDINHDEDICSTFGIQYLNSFGKAASLSSTVVLNMSMKFPLMINYEIESLGFIKFYLAPKMDEDN